MIMLFIGDNYAYDILSSSSDWCLNCVMLWYHSDKQ